MLKYKENLNIKDVDEFDLYIEKALYESEIEAQKPNLKFYTHEELFSKIRRKINEAKI